MSGYTKLFSSILHSTIWQESKETRLVWITMLAMKNGKQVVEAAVPGLAKAAGVSIPECEDALARLSEPDPYSRTKEHEGRRIQEVDGGWVVLNGAKYREKMSPEERREYKKIKQAEYRARDKASSAERISAEKELERIKERLKEIRGQASEDSFGPKYTAKQQDELKRLIERQKELRASIGCVA